MIDYSNFAFSADNFLVAFLIIIILVFVLPLLIKIYIIIKIGQIAKDTELIKQELKKINSNNSQNAKQTEEEYL